MKRSGKETDSDSNSGSVYYVIITSKRRSWIVYRGRDETPTVSTWERSRGFLPIARRNPEGRGLMDRGREMHRDGVTYGNWK